MSDPGEIIGQALLTLVNAGKAIARSGFTLSEEDFSAMVISHGVSLAAKLEGDGATDDLRAAGFRAFIVGAYGERGRYQNRFLDKELRSRLRLAAADKQELH